MTRRRKYFAICVVMVFAVIVACLAWAPYIQQQQTTDLRKVFNQESSALSDAIGALGVNEPLGNHFQCIDLRVTHWQTAQQCQAFTTYPFMATPISAQAKQNLAVNAARLDELLQSRGWAPDRPQDPITTIVGSNPYTAQNGGQGGQVPFHKNIGPISCNLEIVFSDLVGFTAPGAINVNQFSCQKQIKFFAPSLSTRTNPPGG